MDLASLAIVLFRHLGQPDLRLEVSLKAQPLMQGLVALTTCRGAAKAPDFISNLKALYVFAHGHHRSSALMSNRYGVRGWLRCRMTPKEHLISYQAMSVDPIKSSTSQAALGGCSPDPNGIVWHISSSLRSHCRYILG